MDNSSDTVLTKQSCSKLFAVSGILTAMFDDCVIKTILLDAESHEEQDGSKQFLVGQTMAELQAIFQPQVTKNTEKKRKPKILTLLKKAAFPASFAD